MLTDQYRIVKEILPLSEPLTHTSPELLPSAAARLLCQPHLKTTSDDLRAGRLTTVEEVDTVRDRTLVIVAPCNRYEQNVVLDFDRHMLVENVLQIFR